MKTFAALTLSGLAIFTTLKATAPTYKENVAAFIATKDISEQKEVELVQEEIQVVSDSEIAATYTQGWIPVDGEFLQNNIVD